MAKPKHYTGSYHVQARKVREAAYADPTTRCGRCGKTLAEHPEGDRWDAGHINDGQPDGPLRPEARSCNRSAGARTASQRRTKRTPLTW